MYCKGTGKWYTADYWRNKMQGQHGIPMELLLSALLVSDFIIHLGGVCHNQLVYFKDDGQRQFHRLHEIPMITYKNYDQYSEYATVNTINKTVAFDTYCVESFAIQGHRKLFLVFTELFNDKDKLLKLVKENWNYGFRI
jgi:hypothetical protein